MSKLKPVNNTDRTTVGYRFYCPGCEGLHWFQTKGKIAWSFDGNMESPTFSPSLLVDQSKPEHRCHLFLRQGKLQYLNDCHHQLAGKTIDLPELPY